MKHSLPSTPLVSVIIPVQDRIDFLGAALASVRNQTVHDLEVIIVDAGSTQDVGGFVRHIQRTDSRFRFVRSDARLSAAEARNLGLQQVRAPYVAHHDSDDIMQPMRLHQQLSAFDAPDLECVAGCMLGMSAAGLRLSTMASQGTTDAATAMTDLEVRWRFPFLMPSMTSTLMMRTQTLRDMGGFSTNYTTCDDYVTMATLLDRGRVVRIGEYVTKYRQHDRQISTSRNIEQQVQLSLLRQRIIASRVSAKVALGPVMTLTLPNLPESTTHRYHCEALSLLDALLESFLDEHQPREQDQKWILHDYRQRRHALMQQAGLRDDTE